MFWYGSVRIFWGVLISFVRCFTFAENEWCFFGFWLKYVVSPHRTQLLDLCAVAVTSSRRISQREELSITHRKNQKAPTSALLWSVSSSLLLWAQVSVSVLRSVCNVCLWKAISPPQFYWFCFSNYKKIVYCAFSAFSEAYVYWIMKLSWHEVYSCVIFLYLLVFLIIVFNKCFVMLCTVSYFAHTSLYISSQDR